MNKDSITTSVDFDFDNTDFNHAMKSVNVGFDGTANFLSTVDPDDLDTNTERGTLSYNTDDSVYFTN